MLDFDPCGFILAPGRGLVHQLYEQLRDRVLDGRLPAGARLPASRALARSLGVSRNTVINAYEQLLVEGFAEAKVGAGTYVARPSSAATESTGTSDSSTNLSTGFGGGLYTGLPTDRPVFSSSTPVDTPAFRQALTRPIPLPEFGTPHAFQVGIPAFDLFPFDVWGKLYSAFWRKPDLALLSYQQAAGDASLRDRIAAYLRTSRGLVCSADQIVVTCGAQQAISLCAQLLLQPGDRVAVENPGYRAAGHALASAGAEVVGIGVDEDGLRCDELMHAATCKVAYVTPAHQYPTGVTLSLARRLQLLDWARHTGAWIIEDDYDGEYRYSGAPLAPLAALDPNGRVLYIGTFGKVAFPALRLGYLVLPQVLAPAFAQRRAIDMRHSEVASQWVMAQFMARGHFQRHIRRMRKAALRRRDTLLACWPERIAGCEPMPVVSAGLHVKVAVDTLARETELVRLAQQAGVQIQPLSHYWLPNTAEPAGKCSGLVLGFAGVEEAAIAAAAERLRVAWGLEACKV